MRINCRILEVYAKICLYFTSTYLLLTLYLDSTEYLHKIRQGAVSFKTRCGIALIKV